MKDNVTSQPAQKYDGEIEKTHPMYQCFNREIINLVEVVNSNPERWLDTGCGTGILVEQAAKVFVDTHFILADPAEPMLLAAKEKLKHQENLEFLQAGSEEIKLPEESLDVITAVLSHHYFDENGRKEVTKKCFNMLQDNGIYITFENISPHNEKGIQIGLNYWEHTQRKAGKDPVAAKDYKKRFGVNYHPITIEEHLEVLRGAGFSVAEVLFVSGLRAGFFAVK